MNNSVHSTHGLSDLFRAYCSNSYIFVEPGGNFGDYLIYWGAEFLAQKMGISFRVLKLKEFLEYKVSNNDVVYIHGSGGYNRWCSSAALQALDVALSSNAAAIIQGPCTLEGDDEYLRDAIVPLFARHPEKAVYFMTRENISYQLALKFLHPFCRKVMLDHDTAFHLTKDEVYRRVGDVKTGYRLYGFRMDNELGDARFSVDKLGVRMDPAYFCRSFDHWIRVHAGAEKIITNRTHSSILGSILGKDTTLFPSRYHKNRSVWEFSLKSRGVQWSDGVGLKDGLVRNDLLDYLPSFLRNSYKVERIVRFVQGVPLK